MNKIAVIGLGYVGLPLALLAEKKGFSVTGVDASASKVSLLSKGVSPIDDVDTQSNLGKTAITFTDDFSALRKVDIAIICVPTPVDEKKLPNLSIVQGAAIKAAKYLPDGALLVIESTINPGVCDEIIIPSIETETNHVIGQTLHIAHCPERINPGDPEWHVGNISRVLGADSEKSLSMAYEFYTALVSAEVKKMGSLKEAEAVKIVENSFRDINIAFVNELAMSFDKLGINVTNVIDGAATKPFAFMPHYPGIGVGGHCIPVDPYYLIEYAKDNGFDHKFISLARNINESMPRYAVDKLERALARNGNSTLIGKHVCVLGLSYKPNVGDDRESPSYSVINLLREGGATVTYYDPYLLEKSSAKTLREATLDKDAIILTTAHTEFSNLMIPDLKKGSVFLDGRNAFFNKKKVFDEYGVEYLGVGA